MSKLVDEILLKHDFEIDSLRVNNIYTSKFKKFINSLIGTTTASVPDLSKQEQALRRYKRSIREKTLFLSLGPKVGPFFDLLNSLLPKNDILVDITKVLLTNEYSNWFHILKEISTWVKLHGASVSTHWYFFVNIELSLGYYSSGEDEKPLINRILDWVGKKPYSIKKSDEFNHHFRSTARRLLNGIVLKNRSVDQFIRDRNLWATSGGSQDKGLLYESGNVFSKNKWSYALSLTDTQIKDILSSRTQGRAVVSEVQGAGKNRIIISSDNALHIKMCLINYFIEPGLAQMLSNSGLSSLYFSTQQSVKFMFDTVTDCNIHSLLKVPIDQSSFDTNQPKEHIMILLDEIKSLLSDPFLIEVMDDIIYAVNNTTVSVNGVNVNYENGLLSGWRWTALLGTLCNIVSFKVLAERTQIKFESVCCQGDDVSLVLNDPDDLALLLREYKECGYDVNPSKFWVSTYRHEYLRRLYDDSSISGYPCRSILSILWYKPQASSSPKSLIENLNSIVNNWSVLAGRARTDVLHKGMMEDLIGEVSGRISVNILKDWLNTSRSLGGGGLSNTGHTALKLRQRVVDTNPTNYRSDSVLSEKERSEYIRSRVIGRKANIVNTVEPVVVGYDYRPPLDLVNSIADLERSDPFLVLFLPNPPTSLFVDSEEYKLSDEEQFLIDSAIRNNFTFAMYDRYYRKYYNGTLTGVLENIRRYGSLRVLKDMLLGKISVSTPIIMGSNPIVLSQVVNYVNSYALHLLGRIKRISYSIVMTILCMAEDTVRVIYESVAKKLYISA